MGGQTRRPGDASGRSTPGHDRVLTIRLLGDSDVRLDGERVDGLDAPRRRSLLTYLLLHRDTPQPRAHVAFLLWPDSTESQAKTNLRQLLHNVRRALPEPDRYLTVDTQTIGWRNDAPYWLDVAAFEEAVARADRAAGADEERTALTDAAEHYSGDLLPDCYEEWLLPERERLRQAHLDVLERLTELLERQRDHQGAIRRAQELLRCDPLHEGTYRRLMRLHALAGERARALRVYHTCATTLRRELGVEPSHETQEAHRALLRAEHRSEPAGGEVAAPPLIGREHEWAAFLASFEEVTTGRARALAVRGEAGIGKTRLVEEFGVWCRRQGHLTAHARAYPAEGRLAYAPIVEWLRSEALRGFPRRLDEPWLAEIARLLPEVRSGHPELPTPATASTAEERQRLFHALAHAILTAERPLVLALDDVQWSDRETLEFLHFLARHDDRAPLLLLVTLRPEEVGPEHPAHRLLTGLQRLQVLTTVEVGPLEPAQVGELAAHLLGRPGSSQEDADLHRATGGNPLFVVETVREELARDPSGSRAAVSGEQPSRLQAVIERRLDQLSPQARELVGIAGIIGRAFTAEVLREASGWPEAELVEVLDELWRRRIVREQGAVAYDFAHDRIREVAASLVGPARTRALHRRVAAALERLHGDDPDAASAQIASHFDAAGEPERALAYYRRAAAHAQRLTAIEETADLLHRALELLDELPADRDRDARELELQTALGVPLVALDGYGGARALEVYRRAQRLCSRLDRPVDPPILRGLALGAVARAELDDAERFARQLLAADEADGQGLLEVEGHYLLGVTAFWRGAFPAAHRHLEQAIERYDPAVSRTHLRLYAQDPKVVCSIRLAYTLWYLGEPDRAHALRDQALALAEELDDPTTSAYALNYACWIANELGETDELARLAAATAAVAEEHQLGFFLPMGPILTGWANALTGDHAAGAAAIRRGLDRFEQVGQLLHTSYALGLLVRTHLLAGDPATALTAVDDALELTERTGQRYLEAELLRLRGSCLAEQDAHEEAAAAFDRALEVAREQASPALALRTATTRVAHRLETGRDGQDQALTTLADIRARFDAHHDTPDLRAADDLLREAGMA